ncbi:olfactomedin-4-like, partial [Clarias magur]
MKSSLLSVGAAAFFLAVFSQRVSGKDCVCKLNNLQRPFPMERLDSIRTGAFQCNKSITSTQVMEMDILMLGVQRRLEQLQESMSVLENEDDGDLYGAVSLRLIELELAEISVLMAKLNNTISSHKHLSESTATKLQNMTEGMQELEAFDLLHVASKQRENKRLTKDLTKCQLDLQATPEPPTPQA